jgi:hypothetical protein
LRPAEAADILGAVSACGECHVSVRCSASWARWTLFAVLLCPGTPAHAQGALDEFRSELADRLDALRGSIASRRGGVLGLMGYNMIPDGSANAIQVNRTQASGSGPGDQTLTLSQFGFGYTVSESFPLWIENYIGYARYDPRAVFSTGEEVRRTPLRWNNTTMTLGVGYDIAIAENLWLRPIVNVAAGYAAGDASLFASFINLRTDRDISALTDRHMNVFGYGGALMLAYYDYRPARDIEVELRYSHLALQTFGDTPAELSGDSTSQTISLWARYRWPTGMEAFGRPVRWVLDGNASRYFGDQERTLGFAWAMKLGGGIELDTGRFELGALGITLERVRLVARYLFADDNVTGYSIGIGMSF